MKRVNGIDKVDKTNEVKRVNGVTRTDGMNEASESVE